MIAWSVRAVFIALLMALFSQSASTRSAVDWTEEAPAVIVQALSKQGLVMEKIHQLAPNGFPSIMAFKVAGCERSLQVANVKISLDAAPFLEAAADRDYTRHYIYLGRIWRKPDALALRLAWFNQRLSAMFGQSPFSMLGMTLFVSSPPHCDIVERIDWTQVWMTANLMIPPQRL
jgi:hypothetical protein